MYFTLQFNTMGRGTSPSTQYIDATLPSDQHLPATALYPLAGGYATEPDAPSADGWTFGGWYADVTYVKKWNFGIDLVTRSMTLYARWIAKEADWKGNRYKERYVFRRVAWDTWQEHETYDYVTKGSIELSAGTELKVTGSFDFEGYVLPNVADMIRIYYQFEDKDELVADEPVATMIVAYASLKRRDTLKGIASAGTLEGTSVLSALKDKLIGVPKTIAKNSNSVYEAVQLVLECGLTADAEPSSFSLSADHTFDAGTDYLEMVNWLLAAAGYTDAFPDAMGVVQMKSYASAQLRTDYTVFANDDESIMYPEIEEANDWQDTPNVVRLIYNTDDACIAAYAQNTTGSRASLDARNNREITYFEEVSDLGSGTSKANTLKELAEKTLMDLSCDIEYVTFAHAYVPINVYDPIKVEYADLEWTGNAEDISIDLSTATKTQTKVKRILTQNIEIASGAETYREVIT